MQLKGLSPAGYFSNAGSLKSKEEVITWRTEKGRLVKMVLYYNSNRTEVSATFRITVSDDGLNHFVFELKQNGNDFKVVENYFYAHNKLTSDMSGKKYLDAKKEVLAVIRSLLDTENNNSKAKKIIQVVYDKVIREKEIDIKYREEDKVLHAAGSGKALIKIDRGFDENGGIRKIVTLKMKLSSGDTFIYRLFKRKEKYHFTGAYKPRVTLGHTPMISDNISETERREILSILNSIKTTPATKDILEYIKSGVRNLTDVKHGKVYVRVK
ncbi:MAG: hypothetical protein ABIH00_03160 [Armatimonadota bacterium]